MTAASPHRTLIVDFYKRGLSTGDISKRLGVHRNTVFATIRRFNQLGHLKDRTGRGRPRTKRAEDDLLSSTKAAILSQANKEKRLIKVKRLLAGTRKMDHLITIFSDEKLFSVEAEFNSQNHRVLATIFNKQLSV
ncbi:Protein CBG19534, partial [Caenorhabditis briggsae]